MKPNRPYALLIAALLALWLGSATPMAQAAKLSASVDRDLIGENETLTLTISLPGQNGAQPDFAPLEREFEILGTTQSSRVNVINGKTNASRDWIITLAPKRTGKLVIPALKVGKLRSETIAIEVTKAPELGAAGNQNPEVYVEASVDTTRPHVQAQVLLTVRIFHRVPMREAALGKLELDNALLERLGDDVTFETQRGTQRYKVIERRYALFAQKSGKLTIPPLSFTAKVPDQRNTARNRLNNTFGADPFGDPFDLLQAFLNVRTRTKEIVLDVQPRPAEAKDDAWLPASALTLSESWSPDPRDARVGAPVTRTITLSADGLTSAQIPALSIADVAGAKSYPDRPAGRNQASAKGVTAVIEQKLALVPTQAGTLALPAIELPWWNTRTGRREVARLPARDLQVQPGSGTGPEAAAASALAPVAANTLADAASAADSVKGAEARRWRLGTGAALLLWLVTLALWLRERQRRASAPATPALTPTPVLKDAVRELREACEQNNGKSARDALLRLAARHWPADPPHTLGAVAARLDGPAREAVARLDELLYAERAQQWNGAVFLRAVVPALNPRRRPQEAAPGSALPPLYPGERG